MGKGEQVSGTCKNRVIEMSNSSPWKNKVIQCCNTTWKKNRREEKENRREEKGKRGKMKENNHN